MIEHPLVLTDFIPLISKIPHHVMWTLIADIIIIFTVFKAVKKLKIIPSEKLTISNVYELITEFIDTMLSDSFGEKGRDFVYLIGTLFIFILTCNFLGLIPGFYPATENVNTNFAMSIVVFLIYNFYGIQKQGLGAYLKHMMGPMPALAPLMFPIELISHFARILSLAIRLFGNIYGDHKVLLVFLALVPLLLPVVFYGMGVLVAVLQAYVFTLLSMVYIQLAIEEEEH
jgi:F-type H+-transporting ATPase subunit a